MRPRDLLVDAAARLSEAGIDNPRNDAELLLGHVLDRPRARLGLIEEVTADQAVRFEALVVRRCGREPLQHIVGTAAFRYVAVAVGPGVFVPRPETEILAGWAIDRLREVDRPVAVDLCTGSGAIALALATEVPAATVHAVELSEDALEYARRNLSGHGVDLRCGDAAEAFGDLDGSVDVVVANPPYIPLTAYASVDVEARDFDPSEALWSGQDGLDMVRVVERTAARLLRPGGVVGCEHADVQGAAAPQVFAAAGRWTEVRDHEDLAGRPRFVTARRL